MVMVSFHQMEAVPRLGELGEQVSQVDAQHLEVVQVRASFYSDLR